MDSLKQVSLKAILDRNYRKTNKGVEVIPVIEILTTPKQYEWFRVPDRSPYLSKLSTIFDNFMDKPEFAPFAEYRELSWEHYLRMLKREGDEIDYTNTWGIVRMMYPLFLTKVYDLIIENGVAESYEEILNLRIKYESILNTLGKLPKPTTKEEENEIVSFLIIHIVVANNIIDILDEVLLPSIGYLENRNVSKYEHLMLEGDIAQWVLYNVSMPEFYLINKYRQAYEPPKTDEAVTEVFKILTKIEEDYAPPVMTMVNSTFRDELVKGFMDFLVASESNSRRENLQTAFTRMRQDKGTAGEIVMERLENIPENKKSVTRQILEKLLKTWWSIYKNESGVPFSIVNTRMKDFQNLAEKRGWAIEIDSEKTGLVSPSVMRIIFLNNGMDPQMFSTAINEFVKSIEYKARDSSKDLSHNQFYAQANLVRMIDVLIHP